MIISELKVYNFRRFQSVDGAPGLQITFHKGLNALIGENDSGKTAVIDALKLVLLTQSNEYIKPVDEDFYRSADGNVCSEFKIDCTLSEFTQNEAKNFIEYLNFKKDGDKVEYTLQLHYCDKPLYTTDSFSSHSDTVSSWLLKYSYIERR